MAEVTTTKIHFDITKHTSAECLTAINSVTNNAVTNNAVTNNDFFTKVKELITKRNNAWYGAIDAPTDVTLLKQIIGKGGSRLKQMTVKYGAYIIWHNRTDNKFIVWGSKKALISTLHALLRHINKAIETQAQLTQDVAIMEKSMTLITLPTQEEQKSILTREREDDDEVEPASKKLKSQFSM